MWPYFWAQNLTVQLHLTFRLGGVHFGYKWLRPRPRKGGKLVSGGLFLILLSKQDFFECLFYLFKSVFVERSGFSYQTFSINKAHLRKYYRGFSPLY